MRRFVNYFVIKRLFDIGVSSFLILVSAPVTLVIMALLRVTGEGHVFYLQDRVGYKNRRFKIWKFATMLVNSPNLGTGDVTLRNDPRLLPMGKFLRKTKLNELPQLVNLFKGDMSLVGPRPLMPKGFDRYSSYVQERIYNVKPGITGIGSIIFRDEEAIVSQSANYEATYQRINNFKGNLELWYQDNRSTATDGKILFLTAWAILFPENKLVYRFFPTLPVMDADNFIIAPLQSGTRQILRSKAV